MTNARNQFGSESRHSFNFSEEPFLKKLNKSKCWECKREDNHGMWWSWLTRPWKKDNWTDDSEQKRIASIQEGKSLGWPRRQNDLSDRTYYSLLSSSLVKSRPFLFETIPVTIVSRVLNKPLVFPSDSHFGRWKTHDVFSSHSCRYAQPCKCSLAQRVDLQMRSSRSRYWCLGLRCSSETHRHFFPWQESHLFPNKCLTLQYKCRCFAFIKANKSTPTVDSPNISSCIYLTDSFERAFREWVS